MTRGRFSDGRTMRISGPRNMPRHWLLKKDPSPQSDPLGIDEISRKLEKFLAKKRSEARKDFAQNAVAYIHLDDDKPL